VLHYIQRKEFIVTAVKKVQDSSNVII